MRLRLLVLAAVALLAVAPVGRSQTVAAMNKGASAARLASPPSKGFDEVVDGRIWRCDAGICRAVESSAAKSQSLPRECANAAHRLGVFASYQTGAETLSAEQLDACNKGARKR